MSDEPIDVLTSQTKKELKEYVDRIVVLKGEIKTLNEDVKDLLTVAKSKGFEKKLVNKLVKRELDDKEKLDAEDAEYAVYKEAVDSVNE